ncbi:MAG: S-layer homology domain-containing protein [Clostridiales bacterium]|nr:S-layer homology domain-containing protein [Clostridiales bacterium]
MIKKRRMIISVILLLLSMQLFAFADPSDWAVEFVEPAIEDNIVPQPLRTKYQDNITRYEYVLIALKVLEQNDITVDITEPNPFTDISGHAYETEIIKAYNAKIVGGYEDNTFRPDQEIKREEVAALVYNLVKAINPNTELPVSKSLFSDNSQISNWAILYVEFNYVKEIISGTGKINGLDTIDPLGKTTREQAITLLYKVSKDVDLLAQYEYDPITIGTKTWSSDELKDLGSQVGYDVLEEASAVSGRGDVNIDEIIDNSFKLVYQDGSKIEISNISDTMYVSAVFTNLDNEKAQSDYLDLLKLAYEDQTFESAFINTVQEMKKDNTYVFNGNLEDGSYVECYFEDFGDGAYYNFLYKR